MKIPSQHEGRYFYHFTHIDNIESILSNGLLSTNEKNKMGIGHHNVANMNIQHKRSEMEVPVGPGGVVHDYVPFYFATMNKMLMKLVNEKKVDQRCVVFIVVSIEKIINNNVVFTDAAANTDIPPNFYSNPEDLCELDWVIIDSIKWGDDSGETKHIRMAEALIYKCVPIEWIEGYIVFDNSCRDEIRKAYKRLGLNAPAIYVRWFNSRNFYFTKFFFPDRIDETLVTGPLELYQVYLDTVNKIIENRRSINGRREFVDIQDAINKIDNNFCVLPELEGIYELHTDNPMHEETVSNHTLEVVNNLQTTQYQCLLDEHKMDIVRLAAYFHDIGKGPKTKWSDGVQKAYLDHPVDSLRMLKRILTEDFQNISDEEIRQVCLLVGYHDLLGDIIGKERCKSELIDLELSREELYMLGTLAEADICALGDMWSSGICEKIDALVNEVML